MLIICLHAFHTPSRRDPTVTAVKPTDNVDFASAMLVFYILKLNT